MDTGTAKAVISALRQPIAGITDEVQRKAVADALLQVTLGKRAAVSDSAKIAETVKKNAAAKKHQSTAADIDAVQALYDARNPHKKKEA